MEYRKYHDDFYEDKVLMSRRMSRTEHNCMKMNESERHTVWGLNSCRDRNNHIELYKIINNNMYLEMY